MKKRLTGGVAGCWLLAWSLLWGGSAATAQIQWRGYAHDPQHTALSQVPAQRLSQIRWQTPVDLNPPYSGNLLFIHYGSPLITPSNTVIVPVRTSSSDTFRVEARTGLDGSLKWQQTTDYVLPPHGWIPSYAPVLTTTGRLWFAGRGGTIYYRDNVDSNTGTVNQLAFYGISNYQANPTAYNNTIFINTPITADNSGNIYFGFQVTGSNPLSLLGGVARISSAGTGIWISAATAAADNTMQKVVHNCAPALSNNGDTVYVAITNANGFGTGSGYLVSLNSTTLAPTARVAMKDPATGLDATLHEYGTASPTVGPDGDVYFGVLENPFSSVRSHNDRGWLLHYSSDLSQTRIPGGFGWDDTASVVPSSMVPSYSGTSSYLLMTKYNNYAGQGSGPTIGNGINKVGVIDPNSSQADFITGTPVMKDVLTVAGATPDTEYLSTYPNAVREWCINTAAIDPFTKSILVNNEDGKLYRWDMATNTLIQPITLTAGIGEAYTPTIVGVDGTVYAINNAVLFAVGSFRSDLDNDGDADDADMQIFIDCMTGADLGPPTTPCIRADLDGDNDVDLSDFSKMQRCLSGPNVTPASGC